MRILYTGFKGKYNSSYQLVSRCSGETLALTNSFDGLKRDIMNIADTYDLVIMFGLDTNLENMIRIETVAEYDGIKKMTKIDCNAICRHMKENNIPCIVSDTPTKYLCNAAYYHMLQNFDGNAVFVHIPSLKNMSEDMMETIVNCISMSFNSFIDDETVEKVKVLW